MPVAQVLIGVLFEVLEVVGVNARARRQLLDAEASLDAAMGDPAGQVARMRLGNGVHEASVFSVVPAEVGRKVPDGGELRPWDPGLSTARLL